ncbi:MAG TPA: choice-of-anchor B family protein [Nocardioidaceae bacterium]|nr:choice-of-anchor B family protein [Nocardioidaceae bacterium]
MRPGIRLAIATITTGAAVLASTTVAVGHPTHDGSGKEAGFDRVAEAVSPGGVPQERMSDVRCEDGMAAIFACHKIDLASFVPLSELGGSIWANDVWGWTDPKTGREYALAKLFEGTAFVDVTDPYDPTYLGTLPSPAPEPEDSGHIWGDIKTYNDHAFIGSEADGHGVQIFDLTRLRGVTSEQEWTQDARIDDLGQSHNIALNEDSDTLYVIGAWAGVTAPGCSGVDGGPMMYDVSDPDDPELVGCYGGDGYTHDIQCVDYAGPDSAYDGREICVASNEDTVTVLDVTDKSDVQMLARAPYETSAYTHQGWFTEDHAYFLLGDELDELTGTVDGTTTYVWDLNDLENPELIGMDNNGNTSIDHNIFIKDGLAYKSNYTSGLRVDDTFQVDQGRLTERGFFDVYPADDGTTFAGTWGNYPYLESGTVLVTGIEEGLFVLKPRLKSSGSFGKG